MADTNKSKHAELTDDALEHVTGGTSTTYRCGCCDYAYNPEEHHRCPNCGMSAVGQLLQPQTSDR